MAKVIGTVDLTPTRREHARMTAYILASHLKGGHYEFGDYDNYTELEENAIFGTYNKLQEIADVYDIGGLSFWRDTPQAHRAKVILSVYRGVKKQLEKGAK